MEVDSIVRLAVSISTTLEGLLPLYNTPGIREENAALCNVMLCNKQLLPGLLVDSADYHPEKELFPEGNARGK